MSSASADTAASPATAVEEAKAASSEAKGDGKTTDGEKSSDPIDLKQMHVSPDAFLRDEKLAIGWEKVFEKHDSSTDWAICYRRKVPNMDHIYEYKSLIGAPCSAQTYFDVQVDLEYHRVWDSYCLQLDLVKKQGNCELVYWLSKFPWPMSNRDYLYHRRTAVDTETSGGPYHVLVSTTLPKDESVKIPKDVVRVDLYQGKTVVRQAGDNKDACEVVLLATDDPKAKIPPMIFSWIVSQGLPSFLTTIKDACKGYDAWKAKRAAAKGAAAKS